MSVTSDANLAALAGSPGAWIDHVHARRSQTTIVLDMDSSVSQNRGAREAAPTIGVSVAPATIRC
jgi:hypothetical protein